MARRQQRTASSYESIHHWGTVAAIIYRPHLQLDHMCEIFFELCVIGEPTEDGEQLIVSRYRSTKWPRPELFRFPLVANDENWYLDISPDGTRFAMTQTPIGPIYILSSRWRSTKAVSGERVGAIWRPLFGLRTEKACLLPQASVTEKKFCM